MPITPRRPSADQPLDERVASLLAAAAAPTEPGRVPGEEDAVAAFRASHEPSRRYSMLSSLKSARVAAAAALSVGLLVTGGAAVAGTLPGAAQDTAQQVLAELGIDVPGSDGNHAQPANQRGAEEGEETEAEETESPGKEAEGRTHGEEVSEFARTTDLTGREKGEAVSELAKKMGEQRRAEAAERRSEKAAEERRDAAKNRRGGGDDSEESERGDNRVTPPGGPADAPPADKPGKGGPETGDGASGDTSSDNKAEQRGGRP